MITSKYYLKRWAKAILVNVGPKSTKSTGMLLDGGSWWILALTENTGNVKRLKRWSLISKMRASRRRRQISTKWLRAQDVLGVANYATSKRSIARKPER